MCLKEETEHLLPERLLSASGETWDPGYMMGRQIAPPVAQLFVPPGGASPDRKHGRSQSFCEVPASVRCADDSKVNRSISVETRPTRDYPWETDTRGWDNKVPRDEDSAGQQGDAVGSSAMDRNLQSSDILNNNLSTLKKDVATSPFGSPFLRRVGAKQVDVHSVGTSPIASPVLGKKDFPSPKSAQEKLKIIGAKIAQRCLNNSDKDMHDIFGMTAFSAPNSPRLSVQAQPKARSFELVPERAKIAEQARSLSVGMNPMNRDSGPSLNSPKTSPKRSTASLTAAKLSNCTAAPVSDQNHRHTTCSADVPNVVIPIDLTHSQWQCSDRNCLYNTACNQESSSDVWCICGKVMTSMVTLSSGSIVNNGVYSDSAHLLEDKSADSEISVSNGHLTNSLQSTNNNERSDNNVEKIEGDGYPVDAALS